MAELDVTIDLSDVRQGMRAMTRQAESRAAIFFGELRRPAREEVREHRDAKRGPAATWPPRATSTRARAQRGGRPRRRKGASRGLLGRLPAMYQAKAQRDGLLMTHRVPWSSIHDEGGVAGHGARIPRRRFAFLTAKFTDDVAVAWARFVLGGW